MGLSMDNDLLLLCIPPFKSICLFCVGRDLMDVDRKYCLLLVSCFSLFSGNCSLLEDFCGVVDSDIGGVSIPLGDLCGVVDSDSFDLIEILLLYVTTSSSS